MSRPRRVGVDVDVNEMNRIIEALPEWSRSTPPKEASKRRSLFAMRCVAPGVAEGICLTRALGDRPFSEEDRNLVELFLTECNNLLAGMTEKSIAQRPGLSVHTVHQYVKELYRAFGVNSRAELLALCLRKPSATIR